MTIYSTFKKSTLAYLISASLLVPSVMANDYVIDEKVKLDQEMNVLEKENNEKIGFGTGAVIGALVAGPIGAVVTSFIGAFTAKHIDTVTHSHNLENEITSLHDKEKLALKNYQEKIERLERNYKNELLAIQSEHKRVSQLQAENLLMSLQFPSGSSELKAHYKEQIVALTALIKQSPNLVIDLSGYTDLQGSNKLNHALSIARVNSVKAALIEEGVSADRINLFAFGEKSPVVATHSQEKSFYDRRVVIKLKDQSDAMKNTQTVSN